MGHIGPKSMTQGKRIIETAFSPYSCFPTYYSKFLALTVTSINSPNIDWVPLCARQEDIKKSKIKPEPIVLIV